MNISYTSGKGGGGIKENKTKHSFPLKYFIFKMQNILSKFQITLEKLIT